jgi:hypothetical protein
VFKVGDKVRLLEDYGTMVVGEIYPVIGIEKLVGEYFDGRLTKQLVKVKLPNGTTNTGFAFRFELVEEETFTVSAATDQELATEYRRVVNEAADLMETLQARGYTITSKHPVQGKKVVMVAARERVITKTETTTVTL